MGTFVTQSTTPDVFPDGDKSAAPGVSMRPGWTSDNVLTAAEMNTIKDALLDCRTAIRSLGGATAYEGTVTTTDATTTTVLSIAVDNEAAITADVMIVGRKSDGTDAVGIKAGITGGFHSGTLAIISTTLLWNHESNAAWGDPSFIASGSNILIKVTGVAASTINWKARAVVLSVT